MTTATPTALGVVAGRDLHGLTALVTGATSGLGTETARALAAAGAQVILAGRDQARGERAAAELSATTKGSAAFDLLDLADLGSVRAFAARHAGPPLHVLVCYAGIMAVPLRRTADGFESQLGVNHLGHFALAAALLPALRAAGAARVVSLSSRGHRRGDVVFDDPNYRHRPYDPWQAYGQSKTATALFAVGLTRRHAGDGVTANAVMPGAIRTGLQGHLPGADLVQLGWTRQEDGTLAAPASWLSPEQGAATSVWAATAPELAGKGGLYLENCRVAEPWTTDAVPPYGHYLPYAVDPERADRLWDLSLQLVAP